MSKPQIKREKVELLLTMNGLNLEKEKVVLVGVRGYFKDSMGAPGKNDIGIFDDAFIWIDESNCVNFNGNVDPSRYYKNVATLKNGLWLYKEGFHGFGRPSGHWAFRQAAAVKITRWQKSGVFIDQTLGDTINIHRGGVNTTSSAGCQTIPPDQWKAFKEFGYMILDKHKKETFHYLLVENFGDIA